MTAKYQLELDIQSYWHPGTGKGSGSHVDAVVEKDRFGCPFISGRMLKGLVRDAVYRAAHWGIYQTQGVPAPEAVVEVLFGSAGFVNKRPRNETIPGMVRVGDAVLDQNVRKWLGHPDNKKYRLALFHDIYSTAINNQGTAKPGSLRGQQVVVPLTLMSTMEIGKPEARLGQKGEATSWVSRHAKTVIEKALPLIRNVGANRTRGLGRVRISLKEVNG